MGKSLLILTSGIMITVTAMLSSGREASFDTREVLSRYEHTTLARDAAESGFNLGLSAIQRELMDVSDALGGTMAGGTYDVAIDAQMYGDFDLTATGESGPVGHTISADVIFEAPLPAAVVLDADSVALTLTGAQTTISGTDVRAPGVVGQLGKAGFMPRAYGIQTSDGQDAVLRDRLTAAGTAGQVVGSGGANSVAGAFDASFYEALYDEVMAAISTPYVDEQFGPVTLNLGAGTYGTPAAPKVLVVHGDVTLTGNGSGNGLLLVNDGDLTVASNTARWDGIVFVRNQNGLTVDLSGGGAIYGTLAAFEYDAATTEATCTPDFEIDGDATLVNEAFRVEVQVLGAAISMGAGGYDMPVTARVKIGSETFEPWGPYSSPLSGNVNRDGSFVFRPDEVFPPGGIRIDARSWKKKEEGYYTWEWVRTGSCFYCWTRVQVWHGQDGSQDSHWKIHMQKDSETLDNQLEVLKDGSSAPNLAGFAGQTSAAEFVADYIQSGTIVLNSNQTIYLFELGVNSPGSAAHDYQDLVVLVTMVPADVSSCVAAGGAGTPALDLRMGNDARIQYSAEAIAKLGKYLETIAAKVQVVVARQQATTL